MHPSEIVLLRNCTKIIFTYVHKNYKWLKKCAAANANAVNIDARKTEIFQLLRQIHILGESPDKRMSNEKNIDCLSTTLLFHNTTDIGNFLIYK